MIYVCIAWEFVSFYLDIFWCVARGTGLDEIPQRDQQMLFASQAGNVGSVAHGRAVHI